MVILVRIWQYLWNWDAVITAFGVHLNIVQPCCKYMRCSFLFLNALLILFQSKHQQIYHCSCCPITFPNQNINRLDALLLFQICHHKLDKSEIKNLRRPLNITWGEWTSTPDRRCTYNVPKLAINNLACRLISTDDWVCKCLISLGDLSCRLV